MKITEIIKSRKSVRSYLDKCIDEDKKKEIYKYINNKENFIGPFNEVTNIEYLELENFSKGNLIKNPQGYIVGKSKKTNRALFDYGYVFENMILYLTGIGIGTCWLGSEKSTKVFKKYIELNEDEIIPAVSPLGYPDNKEKFFDVFLNKLTKSDKRKEWGELFFLNDLNRPFSPKKAGEFKMPFEMVRLAPSAMNKQPWRIIVLKDKKMCCFYLKKDKENNLNYNKEILNIGIAACHFEKTINENNYFGKWKFEDPKIKNIDSKYIYIATFTMGL